MRAVTQRPLPWLATLACLAVALSGTAGTASAKSADRCAGTKRERKQKMAPRTLSEPQLAAMVSDYKKALEGEREAMKQAVLLRLEDEYQQHLATGAPFVYDVLIISGGGAKGAFGAGYLEGWGTLPPGPDARPAFDMVTGVSTGALIAPFAFVGSDESYRKIADLYASPEPNWVRKRGMIKFLPGHVSLYNNCHLRDATWEAIGAPVVEGIAAGSSDHRLLLVGVTNIDVGTGRILDVGRQAQREPASQAREAIVTSLMASSAIPGVFAPIEMDGMLYADGGATSNLFIASFPGPDGPLATFMSQHGGAAPKIRVWVVMNEQLRPQHEVTQPRWLDVTRRALDTLTSTSQLFALAILRNMAEEAQRTRGVEVELRMVSIPASAPRPPGSKDMFNAGYMVALQELGRAMGGDPSTWQFAVPSPYSVEREWLSH